MISTEPVSVIAFGTMENGFSWADTIPPERTVYIPEVPRTVEIPPDTSTLTVGEST